jgi:hypothetical protein
MGEATLYTLTQILKLKGMLSPGDGDGDRSGTFYSNSTLTRMIARQYFLH